MHRVARQTRTWRIGELAAETCITVRTLHHYDQLGLLSPSSRTSSGHRIYTANDVQRLHRIIVLRSCGLSLEDIGTALLAGTHGDLAELMKRQLDTVDERIREAMPRSRAGSWNSAEPWSMQSRGHAGSDHLCSLRTRS